MTSAQMTRLAGCWIVAGLAAAVARAVVPDDSLVATVVTDGAPLLACLAVLISVRVYRPARKLPYVMLCASWTAALIGNVLLMIGLMRGAYAFPSAADGFWLASYPLHLAGLLLLIKGLSWRRDRAGALDTLIVSAGLGLAVWLLFLRTLMDDPNLPLLARMVAGAFPIGDLLMLVVVVRFFTSAARRSPAFWLLCAELVVLSVSHGVGAWHFAHGGSSNTGAPGFVLSAMLLGAAVLHPSMAALGAGDTPGADRVTTTRVVLIGSACLLSPMLLIADGVLNSGRVDWLAAALGCMVVFGLVMARMIGLVRTVHEQAARLESMAYLDALTGIPNRRSWDAELERRLAVARRQGGTLVVGILDLDHFKLYNDRYGHPAGDELLRVAARAWQEQLRAEDLIARYGGEEFGVILHCRLSDADTVMERLRAATPEGQRFSAGLAQWTGSESAAQLLARADAALYVAKREGRNRFAVSGNPDFTDLAAHFPG